MRRQDYTVEWICAVQTEYVAACELLDEEHPSLPTSSVHDENAYTLGRIGDHHISLPSFVFIECRRGDSILGYYW